MNRCQQRLLSQNCSSCARLSAAKNRRRLAARRASINAAQYPQASRGAKYTRSTRVLRRLIADGGRSLDRTPNSGIVTRWSCLPRGNIYKPRVSAKIILPGVTRSPRFALTGRLCSADYLISPDLLPHRIRPLFSRLLVNLGQAACRACVSSQIASSTKNRKPPRPSAWLHSTTTAGLACQRFAVHLRVPSWDKAS